MTPSIPRLFMGSAIAAMLWTATVAAADGLLFVTPEHSRSIPAALKNAIDWGARPWGKNSWTALSRAGVFRQTLRPFKNRYALDELQQS